MQISPSVVLAGGGEGAEYLLGTSHSSPKAGRVFAWRHHELAGPVPPEWGSWEPWSSVSVLHALAFPWSRCNLTAEPWAPPGSLFQSKRGRQREAERRGWGALGDYRAPWNLAGPNLRGRESPALSTARTLRGIHLPGKPIAVPAPQLRLSI